MIPKIIHYCWFGRSPLPNLANKCIASWQKYLPDYEIKEWNEDNFDVNIIPYTAEAYKMRKYAFVSDYARFWILYNFGGLYFDTDVEIIRPMYDIIARGPFAGCEKEAGNGPGMLGVAPGLGLGAYANMPLYKEILDIYETQNFYIPANLKDMVTIVHITTNLLCKKGLIDTNSIQQVAGVNIYPKEYMCPMDYDTGIIKLTSHTCCIHHYSSSWFGIKDKLRITVIRMIGPQLTSLMRKAKHLFC